MVAIRRPTPARASFAAVAAGLLAGWLTAGPAPLSAAEPPAPPDGLFITVSNPITSLVTSQVKEIADRARQRTDRPVNTLVFDFNPGNNEAATPDYGPCLDLAKYLLSLHDKVQTVAFVHNKVSRHTVLPVLACNELVMSSSALIGAVEPPDYAGTPDEDVLQFYAKVARPERLAPVLKMLDRRVQLRQGQKQGATVYLDARRQNEAEREGVTAIQFPKGVTVQDNSIALYKAAEAERLGLCKRVKDTRAEVAEVYGLSPESLREDPLRGREPVVWKKTLRGPVTPTFEESVNRWIGRALSHKANVLILQLECGGGDTVVARRIADKLRQLRDNSGDPVKTIAFVPFEAPDTATFLAFGCSQIVMGKDATLGNFDNFLGRPGAGRNVEAVLLSLKELVRDQGYSPLLAEVVLSRGEAIYQARDTKAKELGLPARRLITEQELKDGGADRWQEVRDVKPVGRPHALKATEALNLDVARYLIENPGDTKELYARLGFENTRVQEAGPDWLDGLASFLRQPAVAVILVMLGIGCLILELKMPGFGLPGVLSALCFVLFFWSQAHFSGTIVLLAILLFVLGLVLIGLEVFVVPGFGLTGISGIVLVVVGIGLATVDRIPQTSAEWLGFGNTLTIFGFSMMGASLGSLFLARYLPYIPLANRLILVPPHEKADGADEPTGLAISEQHAALLGVIGVAATPLRPAGMARFGDSYVDVVTEGSFVPPGARVQVIEIEGNRVVVKEV